MKPGLESQTAVMVCMGRALADGAPWAAPFRDPTALALLPDEARARVERLRAGTGARGLGARLRDAHLTGLSRVMVPRTLLIDQAVRDAAAPQVVILGAGLDGRAWRMPELREATVFEVDHPDSQRQKRARAQALTPLARELRFVPVDFSRDRLEDALEAHGHDPTRPTTWIWEGVVMYLSLPDIETTLEGVRRRSAKGSRLVVLYHAPSRLLLHLVGAFVRRVGEPLRSAFTARDMRALLARYGFQVDRDLDLAEAGARGSKAIARRARFMKHLRIAVADRRG